MAQKHVETGRVFEHETYGTLKEFVIVENEWVPPHLRKQINKLQEGRERNKKRLGRTDK